MAQTLHRFVSGGKQLPPEDLNPIQRIVQERGLGEIPSVKKRITNKVNGAEGHWETAMSKRFWVKPGEAIEDVLKRQKKSLKEINGDLARLNAWRAKRAAEGIEDLSDYEQEVAAAMNQTDFRDPDGKLLKSTEVTPKMRIVNFVEPRIGILYQAALDLATGVFIERTDKEGVKRVYHEPPNQGMLRYLLDQFHGKPPKAGAPGSGEEEEEATKYGVSEI